MRHHGSKTTQIAAITNNNAHITACEINKVRSEKLKYNLEKQGVTSTFLMLKDATKIDDFFSFDNILLDAPCSGSGTINVNEKNLKQYFTLNLIKKNTLLQSTLLKKAIKILKSGHEMVYSTCSILKDENEEIIKKILKEEKIEIIPINFKGKEKLPILKSEVEGTLCICPNEYYEGFFIAKIRKL